MTLVVDGTRPVETIRARPASSRGAERTSSSSCLIMLPMRITLAGCSTRPATDVDPPPSSGSPKAMATGLPSGPTTTICCWSGLCSLMPPSNPHLVTLSPAGRESAS